MPLVGEQGGIAAGIPHSHSRIVAGRSEVLAIGGPGHAVHSVGMASVGEPGLPAVGIPDAHGPVATRRGEVLAIGGPGYAVHSVGVASEPSLPAAGEVARDLPSGLCSPKRSVRPK